MPQNNENNTETKLFDQLKSSILNIDPIRFIEDNLTIDGQPFNLSGGYKPFTDIYRYICLTAVNPDSKPVLLVKGRQVGATTMAAALECYFMACGLYGNNGRSPMRIMHLFPTLSLAAAYTKDKLTPIIQQAKSSDVLKSNGMPKSVMELRLDTSSPANDNQHFKKFLGGNQVWIESTGLTGDRVRGRQLCLETELPTPTGFVKLKDLKEGDELFDEKGKVCNVTKLHPIQESPESYRITFDDGTQIDACAEHLWLTYFNNETKAVIKNTKDIVNTLKVNSESNYSIPICKPIDYKEQGLTTDPYLFGIQTGKGLNFLNQRIPREYLLSSYNQRLELLRGLIELKGSCKDGIYEFSQNENIMDQVCDVQILLHSIGVKTSLKNKNTITFSFDKNYNKRFIKKIEPIDSKPMRCITVDSLSHLYLVTKSFIPTHNTTDMLVFDEVQDMAAQAIGAAGKVSTQARYGEPGQGVNVLFGTPKQKGGAYWKMWQQSSQQYFHLFCEKCEKHFPLYRPDVDWEEIWLYGFIVRCTHCSHEQDKRTAAANGKWIALNNDEHDVRMVGFHINQLYIPTLSKEKILAQKPENSASNTERIYMNEVLGEFYDGEGGTITKEEIMNTCLEGKSFAKQISPSFNKRVYAGFDWGQKASLDISAGNRKGQSYSCAVVLTAEGPELFSVEFATRLTKNDPQEKQNIVEEMFRRYSVQLAVGDIGDAGDLTHVLQRTHGDMFLGSRASDTVSNHIKFRDDVFPKEIVFERNYYISELFDLLRKGAIKFPQKSWSRVEWLIDHCCSMEIKITQNRSGEPIKRYVKGSYPNDGFMALLNAYLAWKFDVTQHFKIKQPGQMQFEVSENKGGLAPILGYCPDW